MSPSPFSFHGPLAPAEVIGRDDVVADVIQRVTERRPTVLIAPRRFGKTSVLGRVGADLADTTTVISVDLYELRSWADFAARLDDALDDVLGEARTRLDRIATSLEISLGVVKARFARPDRPPADLTADRLIDLIVAHGITSPTVLIFDEFSSITRVEGAAGMLRTKLQHHFSTIGLLFAGSEPSTMRMLFADSDQPFYAQADLLDLPGLSRALVDHLINIGFGGEPPPALAAKLFDFAGGHPQRTMQLADAAWRLTDARASSTGLWSDAIEEIRFSTADGFELRFSYLSTAEQAVMRLAAGDGVLHGRGAELLSLSASSADNAKRLLIDRGQIEKTLGAKVRVIDPLFGDWIRRRFPL